MHDTKQLIGVLHKPTQKRSIRLAFQQLFTPRCLTQPGVEFFKPKIQIFSLKQIYLLNHFSLLLRGQSGFDSRNKNSKYPVTLLL